MPDEVGVEPLDREGVGEGVEKGLGLPDLDPVPEPVIKELIVAVIDSVALPVCEGVLAGVTDVVDVREAVLDLEPDLVRVPEAVRRGEGVPVPLVVCVKEGVKVLVVLSEAVPVLDEVIAPVGDRVCVRVPDRVAEGLAVKVRVGEGLTEAVWVAVCVRLELRVGVTVRRPGWASDKH